MQELARLTRVHESAEPVDAVADGVELAGVGAGVLHVRGEADLGVDARDAAVDVVEGGIVLEGAHGRGLRVGNGLVDLDGHVVGGQAGGLALLGGEAARPLDGVGDGLEGGHAHVEVRARRGRQDVVGGRALHLREGVGRADHRAGLGHARHDLLHKGTREPQVAKDSLVQRVAAGTQLRERGLDGRHHHGAAGVRADALARAGKEPARVVGRGRRGVAAVRAGRDGEVDVALLGDADHGHRLGDAKRGVRRHRTALVEDQVRVDPVAAEPVDRVRAGGRRDLLAVAREVPDVARRHVALSDEMLGRLEERADDALGVEGTAAPDLAVNDLGAKGVVLPVLALDGDDVLVGHHHDGVERGVGTRPAKKDAEVVDHRELARLERARVQAAQRGHPAAERLVVALRDVLAAHGRDADELAEALDRGVVGLVAAGVHGRAVGRGGLELRGAHGTGGGAGAHGRGRDAQPSTDNIGSTHDGSSRQENVEEHYTC